MVKKRTPEEEKLQQEGKEFIQRREKLESQASQGGPITGTVREQAGQQLRAEENIRQPQISVQEAQTISSTPTNELLGIGTPEQREAEREGEKTEALRAIISEKIGKEISIGEISNYPGIVAIESAKQAFPKSLNLAANLIDTVFVATRLKAKPKSVVKAESSFSDAIAALKLDIANQDPVGAKNSIILAEDAIYRLHSTQKGKGLVNLAYWIDEGLDIETEIYNFEKQLEDLKQQVLVFSLMQKNI